MNKLHYICTECGIEDETVEEVGLSDWHCFKCKKRQFPDKYQQRCLKTWFDDTMPLKDHMLHVAIGLASEAGEFASLVDKQIYKPSKKITREMMLDELGDIWYNVVIAAHLLGVTIDELDQMNAEKLSDGHGWVDKSGMYHLRWNDDTP